MYTAQYTVQLLVYCSCTVLAVLRVSVLFTHSLHGILTNPIYPFIYSIDKLKPRSNLVNSWMIWCTFEWTVDTPVIDFDVFSGGHHFCFMNTTTVCVFEYNHCLYLWIRVGHLFFSKERNILAFFPVLYKRTKCFFAFFPVLYKRTERSCVLSRSL